MRKSRSEFLIAFLAMLLPILVAPAASFAHTSSDSFLNLTVEEQKISGDWAIALRDLEYAINLDTNADGQVTWGELKQQQKAIERIAMEGLSVTVPGQHCPLSVVDLLVERRGGGTYAILKLAGSCIKPLAEGIPVTLEYKLFFDSNPQHRGLAQLRFGGTPTVFVFSPQNRRMILSHALESSAPSSLLQFYQEGVWHIWTGYDHILFLIALLLPAVLIRKDDKWEPAPAFREAFFAVFKVVTAFTIAHSITLALAAMQVVQLPTRWVETTIAFSVFLAAGNNIFHAVEERRLWWVAFAFGLIHGFGFAGVMKEFGLQGSLLLTSVLTFNLGVEAGQLAIVLTFLPVAFVLRRSAFYRYVVLTGGSIATAAVALHWTAERFLGR